MLKNTPTIAIVTRPTRLQGLRERWGTVRQAKFLLAQAHQIEAQQIAPAAQAGATTRGKLKRRKSAATEQADFDEYQREDDVYQRVLEELERALDFGFPIKQVDRGFLPNFDFWNCAAVVVVGQDGLVANAAKYVGDAPIVAVNPDPQRFDGVLLPFRADEARAAVRRVLDGQQRERKVSLAEVRLNDSQRLLAFNDFFIGCHNHASARYTLQVDGRGEPQSSSGVLVSTGAGSTGWLSSVFNMAGGVAKLLGAEVQGRVELTWEDRRLLWAVREPFISKHSRATLVAGLLDEGSELIVESLMPSGGVIFSDGVDTDFLPFTTGTIARVCVSPQSARLVVG